MMWGYGWLGFVWMSAFWVGLVMLVVWAVRRPDDRGMTGQSRAMAILEERFARGELDADELHARRRDLAR